MSKPAISAKPLAPSARTVVICCKVPNGIWMQLQVKQKRPEMTRDGMTMAEYNVFGGKKYYINGPAYPNGTPPKGFPERPLMVGGYALTFGVPADFWDEWAEQNKLADFLKPTTGEDHGAIFAYPSLEETKAVAKENEAYLTGLEPLDVEPDKDGRIRDRRAPKPPTAGILKVATEPHPL